jgi:hypothetical protein
MNVSARLLITGSLAALLAGCASRGPTALTCEPEERKLQFKLKDDGCVEGISDSLGRDKDRIEVCQGDTITWKVKKWWHSNGDLKKRITFKSAAGSPLEWTDSGFESKTISGTVRADAKTGEPGFKYNVDTERGPGDVCPFDPMIIVKPR